MIVRLHIVFIVGFLLLIQAPSSAQGPTNHWYFGRGLHFSFDEYPPIVDYFPHRLDHSHSTMSDSSGNLLFYSGNQGIYNKHHQIMINGDDVPKKSSGKRSIYSIIVPNPGHENQYYVIRTIGGIWPDDYHDLHYALVDMNGDDGNGEVIVKNVSLGTDFEEEMVAVHHYNEKDIWVIIKHRYENSLFAYLITSSGVSTPVLSHFESNARLSDYSPSLKISPLGDLLAMTTGRDMLLFSFDNETGKINKIFDSEPFPYPGGGIVEFSADGSKLIQLTNYCEELNIRQYDLNYATFQESWDNVYVEKIRIHRLRTRMQLAIDGNLYIMTGATYSCGGEFGPEYSDFYNMDVIMNAGAKGNFKYTRNYFTMEKSGLGSPPRFVASYLRSRDPLITWKDPCDGDSVRFRLLYGYYYEQLHWDFGDGTTYTGPQSAVKKKYDGPGDYTVKVTITRPDEVITTEKLIRIKPSPHTGLVSQYIMCGDDAVDLLVEPNPEILWSNGSVVPDATYQQPGKYWVSVTNDGCVTTDTFQIEHTAYPLSLLPDSLYTCDTLPVQLLASNSNYSFLWSTGSNANHIEVPNDGKYWVQMTDNTCITKDTVKVIYAGIPEVTISVEDDSLVHEQELIANVSHTDKMDYWIWNFGDGNDSRRLTPRHKYRYSGNYQVSFEGRNRYGCRISDTISVFMQQYIFIPNVFTPNSDGFNDYFSVKLNFDSSIKLRVMNRWGNPVYASENYDNFWEAENVNSGVYFYDIELPDVKQRYSGTLHILK